MTPDAQTTAPAREVPPPGRYGRTADEQADRKLKIIGSVLGVIVLGLVAWAGVAYVSGQSLSGELVTYKVVSDKAVAVRLKVIKDADTTGECTVRSQSTDGTEVGRKNVPITARSKQVEASATIRTTGRATNAELVSCSETGRS